MTYVYLDRPMPEGLEGLLDLALDLRWTWSHATDRFWQQLDPEAWEKTRNPYFILQNVSNSRLQAAAGDPHVREELRSWLENRERYLEDPCWFGTSYCGDPIGAIAYFSMEFGLSEALPIYSGGLGILAGDFLKTASDLGVPLVGIGLLYQQGYFRQVLGPAGRQLEAFPYNDPTSLPVTPVRNGEGGMLRVKLELPGRDLLLRVWRARVGSVSLYLLDSNDPLNSPWDRGITANLYGAGKEKQLLQRMILGVGGWRILEELGIEPEVCHLNEGHAAFVAVIRAFSFMKKNGQSFWTALRATRVGNVFTTHTAVQAAFDRFEPDLVRHYTQGLARTVGVSAEEILALGRRNPADGNEPFNLAYLAMRGCGFVNGVSRLHGEVSRACFEDLFPRWPLAEIPAGYVTNGVHVPSWDSPTADQLWTRFCGKDRWLGTAEALGTDVERIGDAELWELRATGRNSLIHYVRRRYARQLREHGAAPEWIHQADRILDPNALTIGFARRFTAYKRPHLLFHDMDRFRRILLNPERPVQVIVAGKAHPNDEEGKRLVREVARIAREADISHRMVFLEDYDMALAQELVAGIDLWINTPLRPWEACGTSGMKVLVNGGLNLSVLDGWWAEAFSPDVGWALGDGDERFDPEKNNRQSAELYSLLESRIVPEFYDRNHEGIPREWLKRIRSSMSRLTPQFSSNRMLHDYVRLAYGPAAAAFRKRTADGGRLAKELELLHAALAEHWEGIRFGDQRVTESSNDWHFEIQVYLGELDPDWVRVELYAESPGREAGHPEPIRLAMIRKGPVAGAINGHLYTGDAPKSNPPEFYTPRVVPFHPEARIPLEENHILWGR
jgi:starch phosphorylase